MAKTCQAVFRDKNLHQQLTCFLEFGSQTLESGRKDWRFLYPQAPDEQELDRSALAPGCAGSNVRNAAGTAVGLEERDPTQVLTHEAPPFMLREECRSCKKGRIFHPQQGGKGGRGL